MFDRCSEMNVHYFDLMLVPFICLNDFLLMVALEVYHNTIKLSFFFLDIWFNFSVQLRFLGEVLGNERNINSYRICSP